MLFLCDDRKLRDRILAADHREAPFRTKRYECNPAGCHAVYCRVRDSAIERMAFGSNRRAPVACRSPSHPVRCYPFARGDLLLQTGNFNRAIRSGRSLFLWFSALLLGSAHAVSERVSCGRIDWSDQFGGKSGRICRTFRDWLPGKSYAFIRPRIVVPGIQPVCLRRTHACSWSNKKPGPGRKPTDVKLSIRNPLKLKIN